MSTATAFLDPKALLKTWTAFDRVAHLRPTRHRNGSSRMQAPLRSLLRAERAFHLINTRTRSDRPGNGR